MSIDVIGSMAGMWEGVCRTWFKPGELADESAIRGEIRPWLDGRYYGHEYTSTIEGRPRHGEEVMAYNAITSRFQVAWTDDFHTCGAILFSEGEATADGFDVKGHYDVAVDAPRWGWRTTYRLVGPDQLVITAYNAKPEGAEAKAVETMYRRVRAGG